LNGFSRRQGPDQSTKLIDNDMTYNLDLPRTYEDLQDALSIDWLKEIQHPWKIALEELREEFWYVELQMQGNTIHWTNASEITYRRIQEIFTLIRRRERYISTRRSPSPP
jgi:hypothetical protein